MRRASTPPVPGFVDAKEVAAIARFISEVDPDIPYSLLGLHPNCYMGDLPLTSGVAAARCQASAQLAALPNVHLANLHLLA